MKARAHGRGGQLRHQHVKVVVHDALRGRTAGQFVPEVFGANAPRRAGALHQLTQPSMSSLSFEERLAMLMDREVASRDVRRRTRLLSLARPKYPQATTEDVNTRRGRRGFETDH